jgi:hypothetical protein
MQTSVTNEFQGSGVAGEFYSDQPQRTRTKILNSTAESNNVIGAIAFQSTSNDAEVSVDDAGVIAGIIGFPKAAKRAGLDAVTSLENGENVELIQQGYVFFDIPDAANIGDAIYVSDTDGTTTEVVAPGGSATDDYSFVGTVSQFSLSAAGLGVIYVNLEV